MPLDSAARGLQISGVPNEYWSAVGSLKRTLIIGGFPCPLLQGLHRGVEQIGSAVLHLDIANSKNTPSRPSESNPAVALANPARLPLHNASFDLVISCWMVYYAPDSFAHYREILSIWSKRLQSIVKKLQIDSDAVHSYIVLSARKKADSTAEGYASATAAARKADLQGLGSGHLISEERSGYHLRFRDMPDEFKPREKLALHGPPVLKNHELLAVLLVSGTAKENVLELSHRLIQEYGGRAIARKRSVRRPQETLNIGLNKACRIVAAFELGRRFFEEPVRKTPTIPTADDAYEYVREMAKFTKEHFRGLYLNTRNRVIRDEIISIGTLNTSVVHPREVFLPAVEFTAAAVILANNHPSGDPTPSEEDFAITHRMVEAGRVMGIEAFDHLTVGENSCISLQQEGKLK